MLIDLRRPRICRSIPSRFRSMPRWVTRSPSLTLRATTARRLPGYVDRRGLFVHRQHLDYGDILLALSVRRGWPDTAAGPELYRHPHRDSAAGAAGSYRIIVRADVYNDIFEGANENNNDRASTDALTVAYDLVVGAPVTTTLPVGGVLLYRVQVPDGQTLQVSLDAAGGANELTSARVFAQFDCHDAAYGGALSLRRSPSCPRPLPATIIFWRAVRAAVAGR